MALSQSALSELLEAFRAGDGVDLIRDAVGLVLQELIELGATDRIGAARYERSDYPGDRAQRRTGTDVVDASRRCGAAHPEAA
jgi:transposase-like protein